MEFITYTLFGSYIGMAIALLILFISFITSDVEENGYGAAVIAAIFLGLNYFWGNLPILEIFTFRNIGIYLLLGFIFSLIRTYFKGRELSVDQKKYFDLKDHVFRWIFLFPFSLITWLFSSLLIDLFDKLWNSVEIIYKKLFGI